MSERAGSSEEGAARRPSSTGEAPGPDTLPRPAQALSSGEVLEALGSTPAGLDDPEVRRRLERVGPNVLEAREGISIWAILLDQLRSLVVLLLVAAAGVALVIGDLVEAAAIAAVLVVNTVVGFVTELKARRAMEALLRLDVREATVIRGGEEREVNARELVPGDVIAVEAGRSVPADARLLDAGDLRVDEAALTGESVPVGKRPDRVLDARTPLPDRVNMLYKGTAVVSGGGRAVVVATGMDTEVGEIGALVGGVEEKRTVLERRLDELGRRLIWITLGVAAFTVAAGWLRGADLGRMIETGIALAIAAVPEGLPVVATVALAVGVRRMARRRALVRRLPSVESLGSVTEVCTDKTGTLTAGQITVRTVRLARGEVEVGGRGYAPEGELRRGKEPVSVEGDPTLEAAVRVGVLANRAEVRRSEEAGGWEVRGDPTEAALLVLGRKAGVERDALLEAWPEVGEVPFASERMMMATFNRSPDGDVVAHVKGAPDRVLERSVRVLTERGEERLDDVGRERFEEVNEELARRGLRVLALAVASTDAAESEIPEALTFVGMVGMIDPPAEGVKETIGRLREAGIRTVMITGDQRLTAEAVARELGVLDEDEVTLDGRELAELADAELEERAGRVGVYSRVSPADKLRIVEALHARGRIVAMLGDGVNDAPALKKADVGVAMGGRGTDVAREAADMVLQDDRLSTIAAAVEEGRVVFDNIRKFVYYLFSCNLAEVLVILAGSLAGLPLPLLPLQILWLNLITDTFPALSLAVEPGEPGIMRRPPRDPEAEILSRRFLRDIVFYSALITLATLAAYGWALFWMEYEAPLARTVGFMTLALAQTFHLGNARSPDPVLSGGRAVANRWALGAVALVIALQLAAVYLPLLARVLEVEPLSVTDWAVAGGLALVPALVGQGLKAAGRARGVEPSATEPGDQEKAGA